jgi:outer membrane protein
MSFRGILSGLSLALSLWSGAALADVKVGYVDLQRALAEVEEARAAKARLQSTLNTKQTELQKDEEAFLKEQEIVSKQAATMNEEAKKAKALELQNKYVAIMKRREAYQADLLESERRELQPILNRLNQVIAQIAQREGLTLVLDKNAGLLYAPPSLELTNEVVRLYNDQFKGKPAKAEAPKKDAPKKDAPKPEAPKSDAPKK